MPRVGRDSEGRLVWCNAPYARAVEAADDKAAVDSGGELFDLALRREAATALKETGVWKRRASAVVNGQRRTFEAAEVRTDFGSAGRRPRRHPRLRRLRAEMERNEDDYSRMIDRLSTAVAIFDKSKRLTFYNAAYRQIWSLEPAFLDQRPTDGEILDRLAGQAPVAGAGGLSRVEGPADERLSGDRAERDRLASAGRARPARRHEPQSEGRRHLSLRRRDTELRARLAGQRADPRAGRNARRSQGRRGGVRRATDG